MNIPFSTWEGLDTGRSTKPEKQLLWLFFKCMVI